MPVIVRRPDRARVLKPTDVRHVDERSNWAALQRTEHLHLGGVATLEVEFFGGVECANDTTEDHQLGVQNLTSDETRTVQVVAARLRATMTSGLGVPRCSAEKKADDNGTDDGGRRNADDDANDITSDQRAPEGCLGLHRRSTD